MKDFSKKIALMAMGYLLVVGTVWCFLVSQVSLPEMPQNVISTVGNTPVSVTLRKFYFVSEALGREVKKIRRVLNERYKKYLGDKKIINLKDKIVIITDDGVATGSTILAAVDLVKKEDAKKVIVAIPIGPNKTIEKIKEKSDEVVCLDQPVDFMSIGEFYKHFEQVSDKEAIKLLEETNRWK